MFNKCLPKLLGFLIILLFNIVKPAPTLGAVLFSDNFDDGNADGWIIARNMQWDNPSSPCLFEGAPAEWQVVGGKYGIHIVGLSCTTESMPSDAVWNTNWNDYIFETDITFVRGTDANIAFRYSGEPNFDWYGYHFQVSPIPQESRIILQRVLNSDIYPNSVLYPLLRSSTYHLKIIVDKEHIVLFIDDVLVLDYPDAGGRFPLGRIALQASVGGDPESQVWFDNVIVRSIDELEHPHDPLVILPGFGGSWNTEAMITGGSDGTWKKTPFVKVYDNLRATFLDNAGYSEGDDYFEFYYDWRKNLDSLADDLKNYLNNTVLNGKPAETKVDVVGHSLGGMVARAFAQKYGHDRIDDLVTTGSPHEGAIPAWLGWAGADVGDRWSWQWIGLQFYLQLHKGRYTLPVAAVRDLTPGLNDLMPIFDFAKDEQDQVIDVTTMDSFNNYLNNLKISLSDPLKTILNTIAGNNQNTVEWIKLGDRTLVDKLLGRWPDGRPENLEYTSEGDLTVLEKSALINQTNQQTVNANHVDLVDTAAGVNAILNALNLTGVTPVETTIAIPRNPSLLFFLHSPAQIRVTDPDGNQSGFGVDSPMPNSIYSPDDKLLLIYDADDGDYQLEIIGQGEGEYQLDIGQLTESGEDWSQINEEINNGAVDNYQLRFNSDSPLAYPIIDPQGKTYLQQAKLKLETLRNYLNQQNLTKRQKFPLIKEINEIIKLIDKTIKYLDKNNYREARRLAQSVVGDIYLLRLKLDQQARDGPITDEIKAIVKNELNETGSLVIEAFAVLDQQNENRIDQKLASRLVKAAERAIKQAEDKAERKLDGENYFVGQALELGQQFLTQAKNDFDADRFGRAYIEALVARILALEAVKLI